MANTKYRAGRLELLNGDAVDFTGTGIFKCCLVGPTSSFLNEHPSTVGGFSLLESISGEVTIGGGALVVDTIRDKIYFTADDPAFSALTPGDVVVGLVAYRFVTNQAASIPYWGIGLGQPVEIPDSGEYTFPFNADGVIAI